MILTAAAFLALVVCLPASGEVAAKLDENGNYVGMVYRMGSLSRIWASPAPTFDRRPLNPTGDILGDLAPAVIESPIGNHWPIAVWSHPNGPDYDLVFSRWTGRCWAPMSFIEADNAYNDLDPRMVMTSQGRPYLAWGRSEPSNGVIMFSMFLENRWMTPIRVSSTGVNAHDPQIVLVSDSQVRVTYSTATGTQTRYVTIPMTDSITDDIDPKIRTEIIVQ
jgi:hypothetical protein